MAESELLLMRASWTKGRVTGRSQKEMRSRSGLAGEQGEPRAGRGRDERMQSIQEESKHLDMVVSRSTDALESASLGA